MAFCQDLRVPLRSNKYKIIIVVNGKSRKIVRLGDVNYYQKRVTL